MKGNPEKVRIHGDVSIPIPAITALWIHGALSGHSHYETWYTCWELGPKLSPLPPLAPWARMASSAPPTVLPEPPPEVPKPGASLEAPWGFLIAIMKHYGTLAGNHLGPRCLPCPPPGSLGSNGFFCHWPAHP